jgi:hypothetical protein
MVVTWVVPVPEAAVEAEAMETVEAMDAGKAHAAVTDKVTATKTANGKPMATKRVAPEAVSAAEAMTSAAMASAAATTAAAGIGDLG